MITIAALRDT